MAAFIVRAEDIFSQLESLWLTIWLRRRCVLSSSFRANHKKIQRISFVSFLFCYTFVDRMMCAALFVTTQIRIVKFSVLLVFVFYGRFSGSLSLCRCRKNMKKTSIALPLRPIDAHAYFISVRVLNLRLFARAHTAKIVDPSGHWRPPFRFRLFNNNRIRF